MLQARGVHVLCDDRPEGRCGDSPRSPVAKEGPNKLGSFAPRASKLAKVVVRACFASHQGFALCSLGTYVSHSSRRMSLAHWDAPSLALVPRASSVDCIARPFDSCPLLHPRRFAPRKKKGPFVYGPSYAVHGASPHRKPSAWLFHFLLAEQFKRGVREKSYFQIKY